MTATCETCRFHDLPDGALIGTCRRHSPSRWGWGLSYPTDWCGEHQLRASELSNDEAKRIVEQFSGISG